MHEERRKSPRFYFQEDRQPVVVYLSGDTAVWGAVTDVSADGAGILFTELPETLRTGQAVQVRFPIHGLSEDRFACEVMHVRTYPSGIHAGLLFLGAGGEACAAKFARLQAYVKEKWAGE